MRLNVMVAASLMLLGCLAVPASGASFDCSKAASPDEMAVCTIPQLSALDSEMAGLWFAYRQIPMMMGASGNRSDEQEEWMGNRKRCGGASACLEHVYSSRIDDLRKTISDWMQNMQIVATDPPGPSRCRAQP